MAIKVPDHIMIMGTKVKIQTLDKVTAPGDDEYCGAFVHASNTVELEAGNSDRETLSTLCHELAHAWLHISGVNELWGADAKMEETLVWSLEHHLMPVIWDIAKSNRVRDLRPEDPVVPTKAAKRRKGTR